MKRILDLAFFSLVLTLLGASPTPSSNTAATVPPRPAACETQEFRQFDFWLGKWTVRNPAGKEVGQSEISRAAEGCAIREHWKSGSGTEGVSINYYDASERRWHQDWVGGDGTILHLRGGKEGEAMTMSSDTPSGQGAVINRITWTPLPDKKVKQEWATSADGGQSWQTAFVGLYEPR